MSTPCVKRGRGCPSERPCSWTRPGRRWRRHQAEVDYHAAADDLNAYGGDIAKLTDTLCDASTTLLIEAEQEVIRRHGEQIMALIGGRGYQYRGCQAPGFDY